MVASMAAMGIGEKLYNGAKSVIGPLTLFSLNLPGLIWIIFAIVAVVKSIQYTSSSFWESIPSTDPRITHSVDDFTDGKEFSAVPTFSK